MQVTETARMGFAYSMSLVSFWTQRSPRPFSASFAVTNRCNLRCSYCNTPFLDPNDLPLADVETIFKKLKGLGVQRLGLLGGEPLIRKDIADIIALAKGLGFFVSVNSNLNLYSRKKEVFDDVDLVMTSLDGDPETHRKNRGDRSYDGVTDAIRDLRERGKPVVAISVVNENNLDQIEYVIDQAEELDFKLHVQPQCSDTDIVRGEISKSLTDERLRSFWRHLLELKKSGRPVASSSAYIKAQSQWRNFRVSAYHEPGVRCAAGRGFLYVDPQGKAYPCAFTKGKMEPVDMLQEEWRDNFSETPCTRCNVGPMMEFNLLFEKPMSATASALAQLQ